MKRVQKIVLFLALSAGMTLAPTQRSDAFVWVIVKAVIKKVIKAIDLEVQRVQNKTIGLQNVQKALENELSKLKLNEIADWTKKQKDLYQEYFDELWKVKTVIAYYKRVTDIIQKQKDLVAEYKTAYGLFRQDKNFTPDEINYIYIVYTGIIDESIKSIDQILLVVESLSMQMSDADRLAIINKNADQIEAQIAALRSFNSQNVKLSLQRAKDQQEVNSIKQLYGLP
jgi:hypothetical protein